jgi:hypothetical protein
VDRVHVAVDRPGVLGPPWTDTSTDRWHDGMLTEAWPPAAPVHGSSPAGAQKREGNVGNPVGGSPRRRQQCGGQATVSWGGVVKSRGGCHPFIGAGGERG